MKQDIEACPRQPHSSGEKKICITQKGSWNKVRDDEFLRVFYKYYRIRGDKDLQVAVFSIDKRKPQINSCEFWLGYYTEKGEQRGYGESYKKYGEIPNEYKNLFDKFKNKCK